MRAFKKMRQDIEHDKTGILKGFPWRKGGNVGLMINCGTVWLSLISI
jgi:hypothetical protein